MSIKKGDKVYVIIRIDHFQGPDPSFDEAWAYSGVGEDGDEIKVPIHHFRVLRVYKDYQKALQEQQRLQKLRDPKEVEYYLDTGYMVE